jgi:transposase-like protein
MSGVSAAQRAEAVAMYAECQDARLVAVAFNVSHESVRTWVRQANAARKSSPLKAARPSAV